MRIYVAGPITKGDQFLNVRRALDAAASLLLLGHQPFVPHLTCLWHLVHCADYERWMEYDFEWIKVCDAVFRVAGESAGADREVAFAVDLGIPVYTDIAEIRSVTETGVRQ